MWGKLNSSRITNNKTLTFSVSIPDFWTQALLSVRKFFPIAKIFRMILYISFIAWSYTHICLYRCVYLKYFVKIAVMWALLGCTQLLTIETFKN